MTQKDKELLLKDLCARFMYDVICMDIHADKKFINKWNVVGIDRYFGDEFLQVSISNCEETYGYKTPVENIKPYLFPLSSMTEEQKKEYNSLVWFNGLSRGWNSDDAVILDEVPMLTDFYHKNHIDYRGFIEKGLALDATGKNIY